MDRRVFLTRTSAGTLAALTSALGTPPTVQAAAAAVPGGRDIVLGMSAAFRGPSRGLGIELYRGTMAYLEHVNRNGGIEGRKIVIKAYDDGYNPLPAIENTIRLVEKDDPFLLYGYVGTPTVTRILPLLKLYQERKIYLFCPFTGALPQRQPPYDQFVFNLRASYYQETAGLVDHLVDIGRERIAVFYQIDAFGRGGWDGVRTALAKKKLRVVGEATYRRGTLYTESLRPQVEVLQKSAPDAIVSIGAYAACAAFIRDARDAGCEVPIANLSFVGSESLLALLRKTNEERGQDYTRNLINCEVVPSYDRTELRAVSEYRAMMEQYNPMPPADLRETDYKPIQYSYVSFEGFLNARLLVQILRKMGKSIDRRRLPTVVESSGRLELDIGVPVSFGPHKHQGMDEVYFKTVEDDRFVPVEDWKKWRK